MNAPQFIQPRVLEPGLNTLPPGVERYVVRAGGITALELAAGDRIELVNPEGRQIGEITVFDASGNSDMRLIGATADGRAEGFKSILSGNDDQARTHASLSQHFARQRAKHAVLQPGFTGW